MGCAAGGRSATLDLDPIDQERDLPMLRVVTGRHVRDVDVG
jgi:hypothetical protein